MWKASELLLDQNAPARRYKGFMDSTDTTHHSGLPSRPNQDDSAIPFLKLAARAASYLGNRNCSAPAALLIACWTILGSRVQAKNSQDPFVVVRTTQRVTPVRISPSSKVSTCTGDQKECEESVHTPGGDRGHCLNC
jgi:hypothetical protein